MLLHLNKRNSNIKFIELGFLLIKYSKFFNKDDVLLSYINIRDLTLNARIEKNKFLPGPLVKIFSLLIKII